MVAQGLQNLRYIAFAKTQEKKWRFIVDHECTSHFFHDSSSHLRWVDTPDPANEEKGILHIWEGTLELWEPERTESQYLQPWGYCLWDSATLYKLNYLTDPNPITLRVEEWRSSKFAELDDALFRTRYSHEARMMAYQRGGAGWYTADTQRPATSSG
jgi:hypothetical protein